MKKNLLIKKIGSIKLSIEWFIGLGLTIGYDRGYNTHEFIIIVGPLVIEVIRKIPEKNA